MSKDSNNTQNPELQERTLPELSDLETRVFSAWNGLDFELSGLGFNDAQKRSGVEMPKIRRAVRAIARKGYLNYCRSMWTDEGEMYGAGYCLTEQGYTYISKMAGE